MKTPFDEMLAAGSAVREHYRSYDRWLQRQPHEVMQAGYRNRFGHPAAEVVARYREAGTVVRASPACGAWLWRSDETGPGRCQRELGRRYWHSSLVDEPGAE